MRSSQLLASGRVLLLTACLGASLIVAGTAQAEPVRTTFYGASSSSISSAVAVPANRAIFYTSGTVPPVVNPDAPPGDPARYGDTKTQAIGTLQRIDDLLAAAGLTRKNVIYLTAYLVADRNRNNIFDYQGWFDAYAQFFNNADNPIKTARSTVGVASLVNSDWLIEIEAIAAYPRQIDQTEPARPAKAGASGKKAS